MKHLKKFIAVFLSVLMISTFALPVVSFAAREPNDHTSFEDFWGQMTDEEGNVDWTKLPKVLFDAFFLIRLFEAIMQVIRNIFGLGNDTEAPETEVTTVIEETPVEPTTAAAAA